MTAEAVRLANFGMNIAQLILGLGLGVVLFRERRRD